MKPEPADYIAALEAQRNDALNEVVNLRAEVAALRREIERVERGGGSSFRDIERANNGRSYL